MSLPASGVQLDSRSKPRSGPQDHIGDHVRHRLIALAEQVTDDGRVAIDAECSMLLLTIGLLLALLYVPVFRTFFHLASSTLVQLAAAFAMGISLVLWFEVYKWIKRQLALE